MPRALLTLALGLGGAAAAQGLDYSLSGSSGDYVAHQVGLGLQAAKDWDLYASAGQGRSGDRETDTHHALRLQWQATPLWSLALSVDQSQDEVLRSQGTGLEARLALDEWAQWEQRASLGLAWRRGYNGLRDASVAAGNLVPDQNAWTLSWSQDLGERWGWDWDGTWTQYSSDPVALARALLVRRVPRTAAALALTGFAERSQRLGLRWQATDTLHLSLSAQYSQTVVGQVQRGLQWSLSLPVGKQGLAGLNLGQTRSEAVLRPNGTELQAAQTSHTVGLSYSWQWE
ncbi:MAG: hypothetical protein ACT4NV_04065 [Rhodoferax sp.]